MSTLQLRPLSRSVPNATRPKFVSSTCRARIQARGKTTKAANTPTKAASGPSPASQAQAEETLPWQEYLAIRKRKRRWETVRPRHGHGGCVEPTHVRALAWLCRRSRYRPPSGASPAAWRTLETWKWTPTSPSSCVSLTHVTSAPATDALSPEH